MEFFRLFLFFGALVASSLTAEAAMPMQFSEHDPCGGGNSYDCRPFILAKGEITTEKGKKFREFVHARGDSWRATVYFDSPGGNLLGGMDLGRAIREFGYDTFVDSTYRDWQINQKGNRLEPTERFISIKAVCASACVYAFLGGKQRKLGDNAKLGVHQFSSSIGDLGEANAQLTISMMSAFIREMGGNLGTLELASSTSNNTIRWIARTEAVLLKLDNTLVNGSPWTVKAFQDGHPSISTFHTIDPGRTVLVGITKKRKNEYQIYLILTLQSDVPREVREATLSAVKSQAAGLRLTVEGQDIDVEKIDELKQLFPEPTAGGLSYFSVFYITERGLSQIKSAKLLQLNASAPGRFRPAQFWTVLSTDGLNNGLLLLDR